MALRVFSRAILALNLVGLLWIGSNYKVLGRSLEEEQSYNKSAKDNDLVVNLPGQPDVSFAHYAGYVTVNQTHGRALFYWFFEATSEPTSKPLLLWLNGGPGCSSVGYGEAEELGPFRVNKDGASVSLNSYAWNNEVNLLFLESPAGVGFSYSNTTNDYNEFGDIQTALDAYSFLLGWLERFPEYKTRDFFIAGESYAGHYVPQLAKLITDENKAGSSKINLKGIMIGNALVNDGLDTKGIVDYAWSHAILSDAFYANISMACRNYNETEGWSQDCIDLLLEMYYSYVPIDIYSIYSDLCVDTSSQNKTQFMKAPNVKHLMSNMIIPSGGGGGGYDPCISNYVMTYLNRPDVQQALHATQTGPSFQWSGCSFLLTNWTDSPFSMLPILKELMADGLRLWMFSGDWDGRIPVLSTRYSIGSLNLPTKIDWYPWYYQQQVAGWSQVYEGITFATVRGAGHMVPSFQPERVLALLSNFLDGSPLPGSPQY